MTQSTLPKHLVNADGKLNVLASPRCKAIFSDGQTCKLARCRIDKGRHSTEHKYTDHCFRHGGRQELEAIHRAQAKELTQTAQHASTELIQNSLDLSPTHQLTSKDSHDTIAKEQQVSQDPKATGGMEPVDSTSTGPSSLPEGGGPSEKSTLKIGGSTSPETMYTFHDATLRKSFEGKLRTGHISLNEELAVIRTMIQQILKTANSTNLTAEALSKLTKLVDSATKLATVIDKVESTRKVQYTRESIKMDVMRILSAIKEMLPDGPITLTGQEVRRGIAVKLAKSIGPTLADTGEIVVSRETFRRG